MVTKAAMVCAVAAGLLAGPTGTSAGWALDDGDRTRVPRTAKAGPGSEPAHPVGIVVSEGGLNVRIRPTVTSPVIKTLSPHQRILLTCRTHGNWVDGNPVWYRLHGINGWVSARYVHNLQPVRPC
ncbi:SH3 domain-containing protein [Streptomyces sp. NPDC051211]|uniref:SH3 domain-containing protein n=1 Tax=Streptomyces sp. NPDC051211 TaxID=3154643 RepID=UPI003450B71F